MNAPQYDDDASIDVVFDDLKRSLREEPTVPELEPSTSADVRARAYFNLAASSHERFRKVVEGLEHLRRHIDQRFDNLERLLLGRK